MITDFKLLRLLQLASPGLPIGMYSYSQGLERAVDDGLVTNADEASDWIAAVLAMSLARLFDAWFADDHDAVAYWSKTLTACRETAELRAEDRQTGQALARLLLALEIEAARPWLRNPEASFATLFSLAAVAWGIPKREAVIGYLWSWLENQVLCAVKLAPLGQVAGQRMLQHLAAGLPEQVNRALRLEDDDIGGSVFGLALASSRHETQYSRLFRS